MLVDFLWEKKMKKTLLVCSSMFLALAVTSCAKKQETESPEPEVDVQESEVESVPQVEYEASVPSVIVDGGFWKLNDNGQMDYYCKAVPGTVVMAYRSDRGEYQILKDVVRTTDSAKRNFYHVSFRDAEGVELDDFWIQDYALAPDSKFGVISQKEFFVSREPSLSKVGTKYTNESGKLFVAVYNELGLEDDAAYEDADKFVRIAWYAKDHLVEGFVKSSIVQLYDPSWQAYDRFQYGKTALTGKSSDDALPEEIVNEINYVDFLFSYLTEGER